LHRFLAFAEAGRLASPSRPSGREPDSDFEVAVAQALGREGYGCEPQLGVAGFFIDIAVRDPDDPGAFLLAVECDGTAYHSSLSARDRDRLRQEILEGLGWNVHRVWSTDWFRDPETEIRRLLDRLARLRGRREPPSAAAPPSPNEPAPTEDAEATVKAGDHLDRIAASPITTVEDARAQLVALRENEIEIDFPSTEPARGLLRKPMLDVLLRFRPTDVDAFRRLIPKEMRERTDGEQFARYAGRVFEILEAVSREPAELP
jgi:very-short-patch-repair endonuclease